MRFILSLIMAFTLSIQASAAEEKASTHTDEQEKCSGEEDAFLRSLEEELANCKIQMDDAPSTADMNEAYYKFGDCSIVVANKLFDRNYKKYNAEVKKNFDTLVKAYYACAHDMYEDSDFVFFAVDYVDELAELETLLDSKNQTLRLKVLTKLKEKNLLTNEHKKAALDGITCDEIRAVIEVL